jgi:hypothetical protein
VSEGQAPRWGGMTVACADCRDVWGAEGEPKLNVVLVGVFFLGRSPRVLEPNLCCLTCHIQTPTRAQCNAESTGGSWLGALRAVKQKEAVPCAS